MTNESDATDDIPVSTWDELKDAIDIDQQSLSIILTDDIVDDSDDDDAIEIKGDLLNFNERIPV